jgi:hypothetical protein
MYLNEKVVTYFLQPYGFQRFISFTLLFHVSQIILPSRVVAGIKE